MVLALSAPVDCEPLSGMLPDHPPDAVHAVALLDDQVNVALFPLVIVLGLTVKATFGAGCVTETVVDWAALVPALLAQVSV